MEVLTSKPQQQPEDENKGVELEWNRSHHLLCEGLCYTGWLPLALLAFSSPKIPSSVLPSALSPAAGIQFSVNIHVLKVIEIVKERQVLISKERGGLDAFVNRVFFLICA